MSHVSRQTIQDLFCEPPDRLPSAPPPSLPPRRCPAQTDSRGSPTSFQAQLRSHAYSRTASPAASASFSCRYRLDRVDNRAVTFEYLPASPFDVWRSAGPAFRQEKEDGR